MMRTRRFWLIVLALALVAVGASYWILSRPPNVTVQFIEFTVVNGQPCAVFAFANDSDEEILYPGQPGVPECHFRVEAAEGLLMGPGPWMGPRTANTLRPGERVTFPVRLWLNSHQKPVAGPFRMAVKYTTLGRIGRELWLQEFRVPRKYRPERELMVWTAEVTP